MSGRACVLWYDKDAARHYVAKVHRSLLQEFRDAGVHPSSSASSLSSPPSLVHWGESCIGAATRLICNPQTGLALSEQLRHDAQGVSDQVKRIKALIDRIDDANLRANKMNVLGQRLEEALGRRGRP